MERRSPTVFQLLACRINITEEIIEGPTELANPSQFTPSEECNDVFRDYAIAFAVLEQNRLTERIGDYSSRLKHTANLQIPPTTPKESPDYRS
jgi:hypothetical protein